MAHMESILWQTKLIVPGGAVQQQISLAGSLLEEGNVIQGVYTETIQGFTPLCHPPVLMARR